MSLMTDTPQRALVELEQTVLRYYTREALGIDNTGAPLGGLTVERFRTGRTMCVRRGLLCRDRRGRYRPSALEGSP